MANPELPSTEEEVDSSLLENHVQETLETLGSREKAVIESRFGLNPEQYGIDLDLDETGERFNVTRERIRQIESKALRKLRHRSRTKALREHARY